MDPMDKGTKLVGLPPLYSASPAPWGAHGAPPDPPLWAGLEAWSGVGGDKGTWGRVRGSQPSSGAGGGRPVVMQRLNRVGDFGSSRPCPG